MPIETFKTRIISSFRVHIPEEYQASLNVEVGEIVIVTIETIKQKRKR